MKHSLWFIALSAIVMATACKGGSKSSTPRSGDGGVAGDAAAALAATDGPPAAGDAASAPAAGDAALPEVDTRAPAAATGTFLLAWPRPDGLRLVVPDHLETPPATVSPGEVILAGRSEYGGIDYHLTRRFSQDPPAALAALTGTRVTLHGDKGPVCEATIGEPLVLRGGHHRAQRPSEEALWTGGKEASIDYTFAGFAPAAVTGSCDGALFAVPAGAAKRVRLKPADDWAGHLEGAFDETDTARMASEKQALEGVSGVQVVSARKLVGASGRSLGLLYMTIHDQRSIAFFSVAPGDAFTDDKEVGVIAAPSPSVVVGIDADQDGNVDAVVGHARGVVLVRSGDGSTALVPRMESP